MTSASGAHSPASFLQEIATFTHSLEVQAFAKEGVGFVKEAAQTSKGIWPKFKAQFEDTSTDTSGGLFIISSQSKLKEASTATRVGHGLWGLAKASLAYSALGLFALAQVVIGVYGLAVAAKGYHEGSKEKTDRGLYIAAAPALFLGGLIISSYRDFKLAATGKA
jgi:hypothetical protein